MRIKLRQHWWSWLAGAFGLLGLAPGLRAQGAQIPDNKMLNAIEYFADPAAGARHLQALSIPESEFMARKQAFRQCLALAEERGDAEAAAMAHVELAQNAMRMQDPATTFDQVNECLRLDSLLPPHAPLRQRMHLDIANVYANIEAYRLAVEHHKQALRIDEQRSPSPTARRYRNCSNIAICYQKMGEMDSAFAYYERAIAVAQALGDTYWMASALNNLGMAQGAAGDNEAALATYLQAERTLRLRTAADHEFAQSIRDNLGHAYLARGDFARAAGEFERNWRVVEVPVETRRHLQTALGMAQALTRAERWTEATRWVARVDSLHAIVHAHARNEYQMARLEAHILLSKGTRAWQSASMAQDSAMALLRAQLQQARQLKAVPLENMVIDKGAKFKEAMAMNESRNAALQREARLYTLLLISSIALAVTAIAGLVLVFKRRNERTRQRLRDESMQREVAELSLRNQQLENDQLNHELEMKKRDLTEFAIVHSQRRKVFEEVLENLKRLRGSDAPDRNLQDMINGLKAKLDAEERLGLDAENLELVNNAFFDKLRRNFPGLSPAELELCGMLRLGHSVKEIATLRNIAPASVRIGKTRLKKRLGLGPDDSLTRFLEAY